MHIQRELSLDIIRIIWIIACQDNCVLVMLIGIHVVVI
jgi:hypothetical protein